MSARIVHQFGDALGKGPLPDDVLPGDVGGFLRDQRTHSASDIPSCHVLVEVGEFSFERLDAGQTRLAATTAAVRPVLTLWTTEASKSPYQSGMEPRRPGADASVTFGSTSSGVSPSSLIPGHSQSSPHP
jgi:hypothetical protein